MGARGVQVEIPAGRLIEPIAKRLKGFFALAGGMKFVPPEKSTGNEILDFRRRDKSYSWMILLGSNIIIAILIGLAVHYLQKPLSPPVTVNSTPTPTASADPYSSGTPLDPLEAYNLHPKLETSHWLSWAVLDMQSGKIAGSENLNKPSYLGASIKPWIAADYLNHHSYPSQYTLDQLAQMISQNDDEIAYDFFTGGASLKRLAKTCHLSDVIYRNWSWSLTEVSARDQVRMGACIYSGKATSDKWTDWIVDKMRHIKGDGDFGPRRLFQDRTQIATANAWFFWEGKWYINCLAVTSEWSISIIQQWPYAGGDLIYGISLANPNCKSIADQVLKLNVQ